MIFYDKSFWGVQLLTRIYGSAFPRALPAAVVAAVMSALLSYYKTNEIAPWWRHPYPYQTISFVVGFVLVFRSQWGYQRYWEARTHIGIMTNKWSDAAIQVIIFDSKCLINSSGHQPQVAATSDRFANVVVHLMSLMHALSCQALRRDGKLSNLYPHSSRDPAPESDPAQLPRKVHSLRDVPFGDAEVGRWSLSDIFVLRASPHHLSKYHTAVKLPVVGGMSDEEVAEMDCGDGGGQEAQASVFGRACCADHVVYTQRPYLVLGWVHQVLLERVLEGGLDVAAPVYARVHTLLSEGILAFEQCRKIADTPFPFPWAQYVLIMLIVHTLTVPLLMVAYLDNIFLCVAFAVLAVVTYWAINEVARDVEDPFIYEPNELPLARMQYDFNDLLLVVRNSWRPPSCLEEDKPVRPALRQRMHLPSAHLRQPSIVANSPRPHTKVDMQAHGGRHASHPAKPLHSSPADKPASPWPGGGAITAGATAQDGDLSPSS